MPRRPIALIACLAATLATVGCGGAHNDSKSGGKPTVQPTVLRLANFNTEPGTLQLFADEVARASHGTLKITFVNAPHGAAPDSEQEIIRDVQQGRAPLGATGARAWDSAGVDDFQALVAPFLIGSYAQQQQVLQSGVAKRMLASLGRVKLTGVALLPGPMRRMLGVEKSYLAVSDFAGTRIGMNQSKVAAETMRALGATPVAQTIPAKLTGLDGLETYFEAIAGNDFGSSSRSATVNIAWWPRPVVIFANPHALRPLSSTQRRALLEAGLRVLPAVTNATVASDRDSAAQLCRSGFKLISATPTALRSLRAAVQPVYASLDGNPVTRGYMSQIRAMGSPDGTAREPGLRRPQRLATAARGGSVAARRRLSHVDHRRRGRQVRPRLTVERDPRELRRLGPRDRSRPLRHDPVEPEGVHLVLRQVRAQRRPHGLGLHRRRRYRADRRQKQARRALRLAEHALPRHAEAEGRHPGRLSLPGSDLAPGERDTHGRGALAALPTSSHRPDEVARARTPQLASAPALAAAPPDPQGAGHMPTRIAGTMLAVVCTLSLAASPAAARNPIAAHCGDVVTQSIKLTDDLAGCPADGLIIGADNIAVDLNGHTLSAADGNSATGILADGHRRIRVSNGTVTGFSSGIFLRGASESRIAGVRLSHNSDFGILLVESQTVELHANLVSHGDPAAADTGIQLFRSNQNEIEGNILFGLGDGVSLAQSNDNRVESNSSSRNGSGVGVFDGSSHNRIEHNLVNDNSDTGVLLDDHADDNVIADNRASGNAFAGIAVGAFRPQPRHAQRGQRESGRRHRRRGGDRHDRHGQRGQRQRDQPIRLHA